MTRPRDEPYEGLAPKIVSEVEAALVALKAQGLTIILVEQNAIAALGIADRATIVDDGEIVFEGFPDHVLHNEKLRRDYLAL